MNEKEEKDKLAECVDFFLDNRYLTARHLRFMFSKLGVNLDAVKAEKKKRKKEAKLTRVLEKTSGVEGSGPDLYPPTADDSNLEQKKDGEVSS